MPIDVSNIKSEQDSQDSGTAASGADAPRMFADTKKFVDNTGPIKSDVPDIGGWKGTNWLLGKTPGERTFNLLDWWGIGYVANSVISIWAADSARQGFLWPYFKNLNHWFANMPPFRKGDVFTRAEAAGLDRFLDKARDYIYEGKKLEGADVTPFQPERPEVIKKFLENKYGNAEDPGYKKAHNAIFKSTSEAEGSSGKEPGAKKMLYRELRRAKLDDVFGAITDHDHFFQKYNEHFDVESLPKLQGAKTATEKFEALTERMKELKQSRANAKLMTGFFMLSVGGWALMLPIKWLEDRKAGIVKYFDDRYERKHNLSEREKESIQIRHDEIAKEPPQTYASVLSARLFTYPMVIAAYLALGPGKGESWLSKAAFKEYPGTDHWMDKAATKTEALLNGKAENSGFIQSLRNRLYKNSDHREHRYYLRKNELHKRFAALDGETRLHKIVQDTFTETVYSLGMVTLTFIGSRITAPFFGKSKREQHDSPPAPAAAPATPAPAAPHVPTQDASGLVAQNDAEKPTTRVTAPDALATWMSQQKVGTERVKSTGNPEPARA
ncbi:MAG: hypothetical protein U1E36_01340 [Rickettsiales bacterium]